MGWWKADPVPEPPRQPVPNADTITAPAQPVQTSNDASSCPVDPKTRQIWLQQAQAKSQANKSQNLPSNHPPVSAATATQKFAAAPSQECSSDRIDQSPPSTTAAPQQQYKNLRPLSSDREVSSIPRAYAHPQQTPAAPTSTPTSTPSSSSLSSSQQPQSTTPTPTPSNAESETGHDTTTGNWIYPSETQFFNAVMRKNATTTSPSDLASSISSIIPIHNAVNERAWTMIRQWESHQPANKPCNGPKLLRFEGKGAGAKSPRAVMKSWSGYQEPFDRHDWTIQRCDGTQVDYIIDFYQGRSPAGQVSGATKGAPASGMGGLNFYLDVRPKLNSFEGCRLRFAQALGWS